MRSSCCGTFMLSDLSRNADFLCDIPVLRMRRLERYQLSPFHLRWSDFKGGWDGKKRRQSNDFFVPMELNPDVPSKTASSPRPTVLRSGAPQGTTQKIYFVQYNEATSLEARVRSPAEDSLAANLRARQSEAQEFHALLACAGGKQRNTTRTNDRVCLLPVNLIHPSFSSHLIKQTCFGGS